MIDDIYVDDDALWEETTARNKEEIERIIAKLRKEMERGETLPLDVIFEEDKPE